MGRALSVERTAPLFAALGDPTRLRIVARLSGDGPSSIAQLTDAVDVSRQAVSKHLRVLEDVGLIDSTFEGRERIVRMRPARLEDARAHLAQISAQWDSAIDRLRRFVEE